jgi:hypothetical protein
LGAEFFYKALVVDFAFYFPGCDDHFVVVFFTVRLRRDISPSLEKGCVCGYMFFLQHFAL